MLSVLIDPVLPVFAILAIGYVSGRSGLLGPDEARAVNRVAMSIFLPIFIFRAMALAPWPDFEIRPLAAYLLAEIVLYSLGFLIARRAFKLPPAEALLIGFCGIFANNAYYGLPIAQFLYGEDQILPITAVIMLDAVVAFGGTMVALETMAGRAAGASAGLVLRRILGLPLIWALAAGAAFGIADWPLPAPADTFTGFAGQAASPVALLAMGVILSSTSLRPDTVAVLATVVKVVVFPLVLWGLLVTLAPNTRPDLYLLAGAGPTGAMALSLALLYGVRTQAIMQVSVFTAAATLLTLAWLA
ncbi:MAG: AEC family transporter [Pseudomonadota bacterium]